MKTIEFGDLGKWLIVADLLKKEFKVCLPLSENSKYDLVVEDLCGTDNGNE